MPDRTNSSSLSSQGIDFRKALAILSERSPHGHSHQDGSCDHHPPPAGARGMGQRVDLFPQTGGGQETSNDTIDPEELKIQREKRKAEILAKLNSMSTIELAQTVLGSQQDRVRTYGAFNQGLEQCLTGDTTKYPAICANATASFSVVSDTINAVQSQLEKSQSAASSSLSTFVRTLQQKEQEKLNLTAALHLEKIRQRNHVSDGPDQIANFFQEGVSSLQQKLAALATEISEVIDEIQCEMMELDSSSC